MKLLLCVFILSFLCPDSVFSQSYAKNELEWLENWNETTQTIGQPMMLYVFITTLPYNVTHPTTPTVQAPEPETVPAPSSKVPSPEIATNPQNTTKRSLSGINQSNNTTPSVAPLPVPTSGNSSSPVVPNPNPIPNPIPNINSDKLWLKSIFLPTVDQLALFNFKLANNITTSNKQWYTQYPNLRAYVQYGNGTNAIRSSRKLYSGINTIVGSWSIVISMSMGVITSIDWDDGCQECNANNCLDNVCAIEPSTCSGSICDMKFYVAWVGTDSNGIYCTSAGSLPSNFISFSYGHIYPQAAQASYNDDLTILSSMNN